MSHLGHTDEPTMGSYLHISVETKYPYSRMQMARYLGGTAANGISAIGIGFLVLVEGSFENSGCTHPFTDDLSVTIDEIHRWAPMTQPSVYIGDRPQSPSVAIDDLLYDGAAVYDGE